MQDEQSKNNPKLDKDIFLTGFYTYVLQSKKDHHWYTGYTDDLRKRFRQYNNNEVLSTKGRGPFNLIYYEACLNQYDAIAREKYLKSGMGKRYLKNRLKRFLSFTPLEKNPLTGRAGLAVSKRR